MRIPSEKEVQETYRKHFKATKKWTDAWNLTLEELAGPFGSENGQNVRMAVVDALRKIQEQVSFEYGDPWTLAMRAAMETLKQEDAVGIARRTYLETLEEIKKELIKKQRKKGPKDWRPNGRLMDPQEAAEGEMEKAFDKDPLELSLKIGFDGKGGLIGWRFGYPSDAEGYHVAIIPLSAQVDYDDIKRGIEEAFESIDWDEVEEELESEE